MISFWIDGADRLDEDFGNGGGGSALPNHDFVPLKVLDHRGFSADETASTTPALNVLNLHPFPLLVSDGDVIDADTFEKSPDNPADAEAFELPSLYGKLCTLRLVRVLAVAIGEARLANVIPDAR